MGVAFETRAAVRDLVRLYRQELPPAAYLLFTKVGYPAYASLNPFVHLNREVIALGGNALKQKGREVSDTFVPGQKVGNVTWTEAHEEYVQLCVLREAIKPIARMIAAGKEVIITHGNGPQYGGKARVLEKMVDMPAYTRAIYELGLMPDDYVKGKIDEATGYQSGEAVYWTQDIIGHAIKYVLLEELAKLGVTGKRVEMVFTSVIVNPKDPSFANPTKPVGEWFTEAEAREKEALYGWRMGKCATANPSDPKAWRRHVASPMPLQVVEMPRIKKLLGQGVTVIACGGGGVPEVFNKEGRLVPVKAIIDKDRASAVLARELLAGELTIVTDAEYVYENFADPGKRTPIEEIDVVSLMQRVRRGEFDTTGFAGSMGPKLEAAAFFLQAGPGAVARITHPSKLADPDAGTRIHRPESFRAVARAEAERALVLLQGVIPDPLIRRILLSRMGTS